MVQLPGVKDTERAKELIGKTALLEFEWWMTTERSVYDRARRSARQKDDDAINSSRRKKAGKVPPELSKLIPDGYEILPRTRRPLYRREIQPGADRLDAWSTPKWNWAAASSEGIRASRSNLIRRGRGSLRR